ncbi:hypothetical protein B0H19DRAFT_1257810 [Mycena capillaripes]|nr:hypothetical protein B0H19DRAFT_1257810 [Mycena capillaripes]
MLRISTGTSVTVYGTVANNPAQPASLSFLVDNSIQGTYSFKSNATVVLYNEPLWESPPMTNGSHTLVITQTAVQVGGVIFLDYLTYTSTSPSVGTYFIDDRDPSIAYSAAWTQVTGATLDFQHTSQTSTAPGASLSIPFSGRSISFYGGVTSFTMNASMVIDGGPPMFYVPPTNALSKNNLIFNSGDLKEGDHTLVVTAVNEQPIGIDYFLVTPNSASFYASSSFPSPSAVLSPPTVPSSRNTLPSTVTSLSTVPSPLTVPSPTTVPTLSTFPSPSTAPSSTKATPTATIVASAAAAAAVVLIALSILAFFVLRRRRRLQDFQPGECLSHHTHSNVIAPVSMAQTFPPATPFSSDIASSGEEPTPYGYVESAPAPLRLLSGKLVRKATRMQVMQVLNSESGSLSPGSEGGAKDILPPQYSI